MLGELGAKALAILGLGGGSFVLGILPVWFHSRRHRWPLLTSALLCFGAGVLLATALIHMLPELREQLQALAEPVFCAGFFLLYFVDELVHFCWTRRVDDTQAIEEPATEPACSNSCHNSHYGSTEKAPSFMKRPASSATSLLCHTTFTEPCVNSPIGRIGLLVALTLHSALEGLAIGLQRTDVAVMLLVGAVACHKFVVAFCLGIELAAGTVSRWKSVTQIGLFAGGCAGGIGIGAGLAQVQETWTQVTIPYLQAIAAGTLFYVTVCEVLPRERSKWHHQSATRSAGIIQFLSVITGFGLILIFSMFFVHEQEAQPIPGNS